MGKKKPDYVRTQIYEPFYRDRYKESRQLDHKDILRRMYERVLSEMCMNRFSWSGMPDSVDTRFLEYTLFNHALSVFYFDREYDRFMALRGAGAGAVNMYDNPTRFIAYGNQMFSRNLKATDCVPIWANYLRIPDWDIVRVYSARLAEIDTTIDVNMLSMRHPFVFSVDKNERLSMVNAFREVQEGYPVIFGTETFNPTALAEKVSLFDMTQKPGTVKEIQEVKTRTWNEAMTLLGIMNVNNEKKERMVTDEANGAAGPVLAQRSVSLNSRRKACDMINSKYDLDVSVEWNLDEGATDNVIDDFVTSMEDLNPHG